MVEEIYKEFERKRAEVLKQPEFKEGELPPEKEKEILREAVSERIKKVQPTPVSKQPATLQTAQQIKDQPKERQVQLLINLVFEKGIDEAVDVAKHLDSPYLIDELHDTLVDELYNKLVEQGKLKKI